MLRRVFARRFALIGLSLAACTAPATAPTEDLRDEPPVGLGPAEGPAPLAPLAAQDSGPATPTNVAPAAPSDPAVASEQLPTKPSTSPSGTPQLTAEPPPGTELMHVHLALKDASVYQVMTIGMITFTSVKPNGYAREERLELDQCSGEGSARQCRVTHRYVNFEAEPPSGRIFEADEAQVRGLVTRHTLRATGTRDGKTLVEGPDEQVNSPAGQALVEVHRFYCLNFPEVPIGVGAKWKDTCHMRTGGVVDTREVIWEFTNLRTDDKGQRQAEFTYLGRYSTPGPKGERTGTVQGVLYFLLDAGEPHMINEQITIQATAIGQFHTTTTSRYQFARLVTDKRGKETAVRSDGVPFPSPPTVLNAPPSATTP